MIRALNTPDSNVVSFEILKVYFGINCEVYHLLDNE